MKRFLLIAVALVTAVATSCNKEEKTVINDVTVSLASSSEKFALSSKSVTVTSNVTGAQFTATTSADGKASFQLPSGVYELTLQTVRSAENSQMYVYNAASTITVVDGAENSFVLQVAESKTSQIIIKELYSGGCINSKTSKDYNSAKYVILYNNSPIEADATNIAFAMSYPYNSNATNKYIEGGALTYTDYIPAINACWWFNTTVRIPAYSQILVSILGAIDHTATVAESIDLSNADFAMYDPECGFNLASSYPSPSSSIPSSNYLKAYRYGLGTAWPFSNTCPAFFIFSPEGTTAEAFTKDVNNIESPTGTAANNCAKIPVSWIQDAIEVFDPTKKDANNKRLLASVDGGYIYLVCKNGYTLYRNVDQEATEALEENEGKLVYNYSLGTDPTADGSTDPSGIDAEASIMNGAHIIYKDTNNSANDFHLRSVASIKK